MYVKNGERSEQMAISIKQTFHVVTFRPIDDTCSIIKHCELSLFYLVNLASPVCEVVTSIETDASETRSRRVLQFHWEEGRCK